MLIAQAQRQFEWWTGLPAPADVMRAAAVEALAERRRDSAAPQPEARSLGLANGL